MDKYGQTFIPVSQKNWRDSITGIEETSLHSSLKLESELERELNPGIEMWVNEKVSFAGQVPTPKTLTSSRNRLPQMTLYLFPQCLFEKWR